MGKSADARRGKRIIYDMPDGGLRIVAIDTGNGINVYIGVPESHPLAGFQLGELPLPTPYRGSMLISARDMDLDILPKGFAWCGWGYPVPADVVTALGWPRFPSYILTDLWPVQVDFHLLAKVAEICYGKGFNARRNK